MLDFFLRINSKKHKLLSSPPVKITTDPNDLGFSWTAIDQQAPVCAYISLDNPAFEISYNLIIN